MRDETRKMFFEEERGAACPECGGEATYWEIGSEGEDMLLDSLHCEKCGFTWERVYKYAWSRKHDG